MRRSWISYLSLAAPREGLVLPVPKALRELKALLVHKVPQVSQVRWGQAEWLELWGRWAFRGFPGSMVLQVP